MTHTDTRSIPAALSRAPEPAVLVASLGDQQDDSVAAIQGVQVPGQRTVRAPSPATRVMT